jgi:Na+/H+-dicarboxylate symporter
MWNFIYRFKMLFILLVMLIGVIVFGDSIPISIKSFFYAFSLSIKNIIVFLLPLIIFVFLSSSLIALEKQAGKFIIWLLVLVTLSNFTAIMVGYILGINFLPLIKFTSFVTANKLELLPSWNLILPQIINIKLALVGSISFGLFFAFKPNKYVIDFSQKLNRSLIWFFEYCFAPILPLFILGFLCKLAHEETLFGLVKLYAPIFLLISTAQLLYIVVMYIIAANLRITNFFRYLGNMLPAIFTGFSTSSSVATLPVSILCVDKNLQNRNFSKIIVPTICNIHTLGSAIGLTIMALATMMMFKINLPGLGVFINFAIFYTLAKYAVAGVPGGVVVVVTPLLELYLGFTPEMIGMVTALYLLFDCFGTATNVACNGAFAIIFSKIYH